MATVPVIDFAGYGLHVSDPNSVDDVTLKGLVEEVRSALASCGFLCLLNHGIKDATIQKVFDTSTDFFHLPENIKRNAVRATPNHNHGWRAMHSEHLGEGEFDDLIERISYVLNRDITGWPLTEIPSLREDLEAFHREAYALSLRLLSIISLVFGKDRDYFGKFHKNLGKGDNRSNVSCIYYPPVPADYEVKEGQTRLGEHTDFCSVTLLFTNGAGGLQVWNHAQQAYVSVPYVPGGVVVNIGDAMQRWTADQFLSNKHRVIIPESPELRQTVRKSVAFFLNADDDVILKCVDGSDKYPPISVADHLYKRYKGRDVKY